MYTSRITRRNGGIIDTRYEVLDRAHWAVQGNSISQLFPLKKKKNQVQVFCAVLESIILFGRWEHIDYRCENRRFRVFERCVTISNPNLLSCSETGINPGIRSWKKHLSHWPWPLKAIGGIYFTTKWRAQILQSGVEFDTFKARLKSCIFKCIFFLKASFSGVMIRVLWNKESTPI
jgi:hypothetical protein